jgi:hypothetical protein
MGAEMGGPGADVEHHHHHHTGHRWLDVILGVSAVFISLMSLLLALQHGRAMEKMVEMSSWPYVMLQYSNAHLDGSPAFSIAIVNNGVGPAKIETVEVFFDGVPQPGPSALLRAMARISDPNRHVGKITSDILGTVLPAREKLVLLDVLPDQLSREEFAAIHDDSAKLGSRVCYCSVFDECSVMDEQKNQAERVKACPVPKVMFKN